ncbi:MAG: hypothetical protein KatS3mg081_0845 [Gemmatimonadales bacterium]|nr:MAG: hypothetical protein KatS3mg081_0845 [Gemmatimonadales bacterium]
MDYRYGDFPELFWDAKPEAPIDLEHPTVLARILTRSSPEVLVRLVSPERLLEHLPRLPLNEHARAFWERVALHLQQRLARRSPAESASTSAAE